MQNSLFEENLSEPSESVEGINQEILEKGKALFPDKFFIFGTGKTDAQVVVIGESPGLPDADSEKPFMGPVGQLLEKILLAVGLKREEVYLTNVVKFISSGDEITPEILHHRGLIKKAKHDLVILGNGEISKALKISAHRFTKTAKDKIEKAGGNALQITKEAIG